MIIGGLAFVAFILNAAPGTVRLVSPSAALSAARVEA